MKNQLCIEVEDERPPQIGCFVKAWRVQLQYPGLVEAEGQIWQDSSGKRLLVPGSLAGPSIFAYAFPRAAGPRFARKSLSPGRPPLAP